MRVGELYGFGQPGVHLPLPPPPIQTSTIGVNVYTGGTPLENGAWKGGEPVEGAEIAVSFTPIVEEVEPKPAPSSELVGDEAVVVRAKTPKSGYVEVLLPAPPGTEVDVVVTYAGETQHQRIKTARSSGDAMAEFHFKIGEGVGVPVLAFSIPVAIIVLLVGYWLWSGK